MPSPGVSPAHPHNSFENVLRILGREGQALLDYNHTNKLGRHSDELDRSFEKLVQLCQNIFTSGSQVQKDLLRSELLKEFHKQFVLAHKPGRILNDGTILPPIIAIDPNLLEFSTLLLRFGMHEALQVLNHAYMNIERLKRLISIEYPVVQADFQLRVRAYFNENPSERLRILSMLSENSHHTSMVGELYETCRDKEPLPQDPKKPWPNRLALLLSEGKNLTVWRLTAQEIQGFVKKNPSQIAEISNLLMPYPHHNRFTEGLLSECLEKNPFLPWNVHLKAVDFLDKLRPGAMASAMPSMFGDNRFNHKNAQLYLFYKCFVSQDDEMFGFTANFFNLLDPWNPYQVQAVDWLYILEADIGDKISRNCEIAIKLVGLAMPQCVSPLDVRIRQTIKKYGVGANPEQIVRLRVLLLGGLR